MGDIPTQVRVRTDPDDGYAHRYKAIQSAKDTFDVGNKTAAIVQACDLAGRVLPALEDALEDADIRPSEKEKLAEKLSTRQISVEVDTGRVNLESE